MLRLHLVSLLFAAALLTGCPSPKPTGSAGWTPPAGWPLPELATPASGSFVTAAHINQTETQAAYDGTRDRPSLGVHGTEYRTHFASKASSDVLRNEIQAMLDKGNKGFTISFHSQPLLGGGLLGRADAGKRRIVWTSADRTFQVDLTPVMHSPHGYYSLSAVKFDGPLPVVRRNR